MKHTKIALALAALATAACGTQNAKSQKLTDRQVAGVLGSLDQSEIAVARAALPQLQDDGARRFAQMMIDQHTADQQQVSQLLQQQGITPEASPLSQAIDRDAAGTVDQFNDPDTMQTDVGYADNQVRSHQQALTLIDCVLSPDVTNSTLKSALTGQVRTMVATHEGDATSLATTLRRSSQGMGNGDGGTSDGGSVLLPLGEGAVGGGADCSNLCTRFNEGGPLIEDYRTTVCK